MGWIGWRNASCRFDWIDAVSQLVAARLQLLVIVPVVENPVIVEIGPGCHLDMPWKAAMFNNVTLSPSRMYGINWNIRGISQSAGLWYGTCSFSCIGCFVIAATVTMPRIWILSRIIDFRRYHFCLPCDLFSESTFGIPQGTECHRILKPVQAGVLCAAWREGGGSENWSICLHQHRSGQMFARNENSCPWLCGSRGERGAIGRFFVLTTFHYMERNLTKRSYTCCVYHESMGCSFFHLHECVDPMKQWIFV